MLFSIPGCGLGFAAILQHKYLLMVGSKFKINKTEVWN